MATESDELVKLKPELRLLLVGRSGCGKSSTGNTILGRKCFNTSLLSRSVTTTTAVEETFRCGRKVVVVDTPGFFDTERTNDEIGRQIVKIFGYLQQGFHALLYVMGVGRYTEECIRTKEIFFQTFGEAVARYTVIVITHYDVLKEEQVGRAAYLAQSAKQYMDFQICCGRRVLFFNNKGSEREKERYVRQLFDMVDGIGRSNIRPCFSNTHLKVMRAYFQIEERKSVIKVDRAKRALRRRAWELLRRERSEHWASVRKMPETVDSSLQHTPRTPNISTIPKIKPKHLPHPTKRYKEETLELFTKLPPIANRKQQENTTVEEVHEETMTESDGEDGELEAETEDIMRDLNYEPEVVGSDECSFTPLPDDVRPPTESETDKRNLVNNKDFFDRLFDFFTKLFRQGKQA